jgi:hypothetical protein
MSLPELPPGWVWEATVTDKTVTVSLINTIVTPHVTLASREVSCAGSTLWEDKIELIAKGLWEKMNTAAKLAADMGIWIQYE